VSHDERTNETNGRWSRLSHSLTHALTLYVRNSEAFVPRRRVAPARQPVSQSFNDTQPVCWWWPGCRCSFWLSIAQNSTAATPPLYTYTRGRRGCGAHELYPRLAAAAANRSERASACTQAAHTVHRQCPTFYVLRPLSRISDRPCERKRERLSVSE